MWSHIILRHNRLGYRPDMSCWVDVGCRMGLRKGCRLLLGQRPGPTAQRTVGPQTWPRVVSLERSQVFEQIVDQRDDWRRRETVLEVVLCNFPRLFAIDTYRQ
jgi:hypothetical protein